MKKKKPAKLPKREVTAKNLSEERVNNKKIIKEMMECSEYEFKSSTRMGNKNYTACICKKILADLI